MERPFFCLADCRILADGAKRSRLLLLLLIFCWTLDHLDGRMKMLLGLFYLLRKLCGLIFFESACVAGFRAVAQSCSL